jgi:hypothetical protein
MAAVRLESDTESVDDFKLLMLTNLATALNLIDSGSGTVDTSEIRCGFGKVEWHSSDNLWHPKLY